MTSRRRGRAAAASHRAPRGDGARPEILVTEGVEPEGLPSLVDELAGIVDDDMVEVLVPLVARRARRRGGSCRRSRASDRRGPLAHPPRVLVYLGQVGERDAP